MNRSSLVFLLALAAGVAQAQGVGGASAMRLPLKEGRYMVGGCDRFNEANGYIGIGTHREGPNKGQQYMVPQAERQEGYCTLRKLAPMGAVLSGVAECDSGLRNNPTPLGTYRFNLTVHDGTSFTSLGKRYGWCPPR